MPSHNGKSIRKWAEDEVEETMNGGTALRCSSWHKWRPHSSHPFYHVEWNDIIYLFFWLPLILLCCLVPSTSISTREIHFRCSWRSFFRCRFSSHSFIFSSFIISSMILASLSSSASKWWYGCFAFSPSVSKWANTRAIARVRVCSNDWTYANVNIDHASSRFLCCYDIVVSCVRLLDFPQFDSNKNDICT